MSLQSLLQPLDCRPGREAYQFLVGQHDVADPPCLRLVLGGTYRLAKGSQGLGSVLGGIGRAEVEIAHHVELGRSGMVSLLWRA